MQSLKSLTRVPLRTESEDKILTGTYYFAILVTKKIAGIRMRKNYEKDQLLRWQFGRQKCQKKCFPALAPKGQGTSIFFIFKSHCGNLGKNFEAMCSYTNI